MGFGQQKPVFCDLSENLGAWTSCALRVGEFVGQGPIQQIENLLFPDVEFFSSAQSSPAFNPVLERNPNFYSHVRRMRVNRFKVPICPSAWQERSEI